MWHRQTSADDRVGLHIDNNTAFSAIIPPAIGNIGLRNSGRKGGRTNTHRQTVQMTTIFSGEP